MNGDGFFTAALEGKKCRIPYRTNHGGWSGFWRDLLDRPSRKALCDGTRNFDGHVRERNLIRLLGCGEIQYSSLPYILKLAEEYVVEIIERVVDGLPRIPDAMLKEFLRENPKWLDLMEARNISYWNENYRPSRHRLNINDILMEKGGYQIEPDRRLWMGYGNLWVRKPDDKYVYAREEYPGMRAVEYLRNIH